MFSVNDYLLVDRGGEMFKISLKNLNNKFLLMDDNDNVEELTDRIDEMKEYITDLSSEVIENYISIPELNEKYEQKISTDYMLEDPSVLTEDKIEKKIDQSNLVLKTLVDESFDDQIELCENIFEKAQDSMNKWF